MKLIKIFDFILKKRVFALDLLVCSRKIRKITQGKLYLLKKENKTRKTKQRIYL